MKKLVATLLIILLFLSFGTVFAVEERNIMETNTASQIIEESEKVNDEMDEYTRKYGARNTQRKSYGTGTSKACKPRGVFGGIATTLYRETYKEWHKS